MPGRRPRHRPPPISAGQLRRRKAKAKKKRQERGAKQLADPKKAKLKVYRLGDEEDAAFLRGTLSE
jgi:hypothetical protein